MSEEREFKINITGDAGGIVAAGKQGVNALKGVAEAASGEAAPALDKLGQVTEEGGKASGRSGISHRALHLIFRQVGEASKGLEVGLMGVSGVMLGSLTFGIYAVVTAIKVLMEHFEKQKEIVLEAAKATVQFWTAVLQGNADARKAAEDYAGALQKIITNVDTLKQKESEEEAVLKRVAAARLEILAAEEQAELAKAKGDKEEEARIKARYGQRKTGIELQNEQDEINLKKQHFAEQAADALKKEQAAAAAEKAKEAGAPGRSEAVAAEARLKKLSDELPKLQAARMNPTKLAALQAEVTRDSEKPSYATNPTGGVSITAAGAARIQLSEAQNAEKAYSAAQQDYEKAQADIERFKKGTAALAKAAEEALQEFNKAVTAARATNADIGRAEAVHAVNVDTANTVKGIQDKALIEGAGGKYGPASLKVLHEVGAMSGTAQGQKMSAEDTAYFNNLIATARVAGKEDMVRAVIKELKDFHVDDAKKWQDLWDAIQTLRGQVKDTYNR